MAMHDYDPDGAFIDDYAEYYIDEYDEEYEEEDSIGIVETMYGDEMEDYIATKYDIERKRRAEDKLNREIESEESE